MNKPGSIVSYPSPNFGGKMTDVFFLVIHSTMIDLETTLNRLTDVESNVSCHYIIDKNGKIYELINARVSNPFIAWHAGASRTKVNGKTTDNLNRCSIGIELVNLNGNLFPYSIEQYRSVSWLISQLRIYHENLNHPEYIIGHEQISGFRGKTDPGKQFNWEMLYSLAFPKLATYPVRQEEITRDLLSILTCYKSHILKEPGYSGQLSLICEKIQGDYNKASTKPALNELREKFIQELRNFNIAWDLVIPSKEMK